MFPPLTLRQPSLWGVDQESAKYSCWLVSCNPTFQTESASIWEPCLALPAELAHNPFGRAFSEMAGR